jgi:hypothetical protein
MPVGPMPPAGQPMPPAGQPMLSSDQPMPPAGQPMPPAGQPMPPAGQPMPPAGQPMPLPGEPGGPPPCPFPCGAQPGAQPPLPMSGDQVPSLGQPLSPPGGPTPLSGQPGLQPGDPGLPPPPGCPFPCGAPAGAQPPLPGGPVPPSGRAPQAFAPSVPGLADDPEWTRIQSQLAGSANVQDRASAAFSALRLLQQHGVPEQGADLLASIDTDVKQRLQQVSQQVADPQADQAVVLQQLDELNALQRQVDALKQDMNTTPSTATQNLQVMGGPGADPASGNPPTAQNGPAPTPGDAPDPGAVPAEAAGA